MADDGPPLFRPVPRRPFAINFSAATTPTDDDDSDYAPNPNRNLSSSHLGFPSGASSMSRTASNINLTSSTLGGIFSPSVSSSRVFSDGNIINETPWGMGAQTPLRRPNIDDATYELMKARSQLARRRSSNAGRDADALPSPPPASISTAGLVLRALSLITLGLGYGFLVTHFHKNQNIEGLLQSGDNWKYLAFWGVGGIVIGGTLPWLDRQDIFGSDADAVEEGPDLSSHDAPVPTTDFTLVMRAIGAFVGIVFAIRKLPWASTLQASGTLALVNPLLWWLIDRSASGFALSTFISLAGTALLLGVNREMMPAPSSLLVHTTNSSMNTSAEAESAFALSVEAQETMITGVWMASVLFCSCVCFGNIGRRLSWTKESGSRGRWGGVR